MLEVNSQDAQMVFLASKMQQSANCNDQIQQSDIIHQINAQLEQYFIEIHNAHIETAALSFARIDHC
jgi:hypothetical protein